MNLTLDQANSLAAARKAEEVAAARKAKHDRQRKILQPLVDALKDDGLTIAFKTDYRGDLSLDIANVARVEFDEIGGYGYRRTGATPVVALKPNYKVADKTRNYQFKPGGSWNHAKAAEVIREFVGMADAEARRRADQVKAETVRKDAVAQAHTIKAALAPIAAAASNADVKVYIYNTSGYPEQVTPLNLSIVGLRPEKVAQAIEALQAAGILLTKAE